MTVGYSGGTYAGYRMSSWMEAANVARGRPGHGFYRDDEPWAMLDKTFEVARQVREYPDGILGQYELENWRYVTLDKSVPTVGEISRSPRKTPASPSGIRVSGPGVSR